MPDPFDEALIGAVLCALPTVAIIMQDYGQEILAENPNTGRGCFLRLGKQRVPTERIAEAVAFLQAPQVELRSTRERCADASQFLVRTDYAR